MRGKLSELAEYGKFIADSPVCIAVFCHDTKYYIEDGSAATQNILVAATALGLGSCWVAGDKKAYADQVRKLLGAPNDCRLLSLIAIGYPAGAASPPSKRPLTDLMHWEKY